MLHARTWLAGALGLLLTIGGTTTPVRAQGWDPGDIGSELWAWSWAGYQSQNVVLDKSKMGPIITQMSDLSGRGNHFFTNGQKPPAYASSLSVSSAAKGGAYQTPLPVVGLDSYANGNYVYGNVLYQSKTLNAAGGFYLATACMNTRYAGTRELFGTTARDAVYIDQKLDAAFITVGGAWRRLCPDGALPKGVMVLEIWRNSNGVLTCFANGQKITKDKVTTTNVCQISGLGYDGVGTSQWDDYWMEFVMCDALPPKAERAAVREYLRAKWNVWGDPAAPQAVITPVTGTELAQPTPFSVNMSDPNGDLAWVSVHVMLNGDTRIWLPYSYFTVTANADGSRDLDYLFDLPNSGFVDLTVEVLLIDKAWNQTTTTATYYPGQ